MDDMHVCVRKCTSASEYERAFVCACVCVCRKEV